LERYSAGRSDGVECRKRRNELVSRGKRKWRWTGRVLKYIV
jgi:hypothetical protein